MNEIDLIPSDYRLHIKQLTIIKFFSILSITVFVFCVGFYLYLSNAQKSINTEIKQLEKKKYVVTQQSNALMHLRQKQSKYEQQLVLLKGLQGSNEVEQMFIAIDKSLVDGEVWFQNWRFQRAGTSVIKVTDVDNSGHIIVIPGERKDAEPLKWKIDTQMTIQGRAHDHSALSRFVNRLFNQQEIKDVRVLKTSLKPHTRTTVVDFDLAIIVASMPGD